MAAAWGTDIWLQFQCVEALRDYIRANMRYPFMLVTAILTIGPPILRVFRKFTCSVERATQTYRYQKLGPKAPFDLSGNIDYRNASVHVTDGKLVRAPVLGLTGSAHFDNASRTNSRYILSECPGLPRQDCYTTLGLGDHTWISQPPPQTTTWPACPKPFLRYKSLPASPPPRCLAKYPLLACSGRQQLMET